MFLNQKETLLLDIQSFCDNQIPPIVSSQQLEEKYPYKQLAQLTRILEEEGFITCFSSSSGRYDCKLLARGVSKAEHLKKKKKKRELLSYILIACVLIIVGGIYVFTR